MKKSKGLLDDAFYEMRKDKGLATFFCRESLKMEMTELLWEVMTRRKWSKKKMAEKIGMDLTKFQSVLNGVKILSMNQLSDVFFKLGYRLELKTKKWDK